MKTGFAKPRLFVSKCLSVAACRWDGVTIQDDFVNSLKSHVDFVTACPEVEIGLGVPRDPIRIVSRSSGELKLVQTKTGKDVSGAMKSFARKFLEKLGEIDGFILKDRSPSCGLDNVKVYGTLESSASIAMTHGFFGAEIPKHFSHLPIETEERLTNHKIREHFLARVFASADLRREKRLRG